jgi:hypothetical protein
MEVVLMRQKPELWPGSERIQWGCAFMHLLGEKSLEHLHLVLTGLRSIDRSLQVAPFAHEVETVRSILGDLLTKNAVQNAVYDFLSDAAHRSFSIDPKTLQFTTIYGDHLDPTLREAQAILQRGLPRKPLARPVADSTKDLIASPDRLSQIPIRLNGIQFPPIQKHSRVQRPRPVIRVPIAELVALAQALDAEDEQAGRRSLDWSGRLQNIIFRRTSGRGLVPTDTLDFTDLKHLIGLPGSGKTTLITLLCVFLKRRQQRVAVFFTSITVAREYLETLRRYGVNAAILMGRSAQTHRRHANTVAELIAGQGSGGFGYTREGVDLFGTSCPLPAFTASWPEHWQSGDTACESLFEVGSDEALLCPAWELCGRMKNQRSLVTADVWLGHILSSDTAVAAHTITEQMHFFELLSETFDLLIFDECDEAQKVLDEHGALILQLTGNDDSFHTALQRMTSLLAANRARVSDGLLRYILQANEFERHMLRFLSEIRHLFKHKGTQRLAQEYADKLLTANFLIREALRAADTHSQFSSKALSGLSDFWERAMYRAFFFRSVEEEGWPKAAKFASDLGLTEDDAHQKWRHVNRALKRYLSLDHAAEADEIVDEIVGLLKPLFRIHDAPTEHIRAHVRLLIAVGFTVASYQRLATSARPLAQRNEIADDLVFSKASAEMREQIPRSLLGTFSAVRYRQAPGIDGYEIDYLVMDTTPRMLLQHLHERGRANVLLASATSWLPTSTTYHLAKKPDYILSPRANEMGSVRLHVLTKLHPVTRQPLRFSGAGLEREDHLRHIVTALTQTDIDDLSELEKAVRAVTTPLGKSRKAVLVVNSYDQVSLVTDQIHLVNPRLGKRTRGVLHQYSDGVPRQRYVLKGQVEELGNDENVDVLIFPIAALGRGINIVFHTQDADDGKAAVGSVYFLTRPHPAAGDLSLLNSLLACATQELDHADFHHLTLAEVQRMYDQQRYHAYRRIANVLARPMSASRLDEKTLINFAANLLVPILQTIGRGMRKQMSVYVYFVDAAWAPKSAEGERETERSSLLVVMQQVLQRALSDPDPDLRDIASALYGTFYGAFDNIIGLKPPQVFEALQDDFFDPSASTHEAEFNGYDPDDDAPTFHDNVDFDEDDEVRP